MTDPKNGQSVWRIGNERAPVSPRGHTPAAPGRVDLRPLRRPNPTLRLADDSPPSGRRTIPAARTGIDPRHAVAKENRLASGMSPLDARWIFALKASQLLEGGVAAILRPEHRRRLLSQARRIGLRDFDANLIIAIVQDGRRSGHGALNPDVEQRLTLIHPADPAAAEPPRYARLIGIALGLGIALAALLIGSVH